MTMKSVLRWVVYAALFAVPVIPLVVANTLFFPFITGKGFVFRILVEIAFFAWLLLALGEPRYRPKFSWILVVYAAFVGWMFIADAFAVNSHKAFWSNFERMEGWVTLIHVFLFFLVSGAVLTADKLWRKWWLMFSAIAAVLVAYCLLQLSGALTIHQGGVRVDGTFGNAAYLAAYLLFAVAIALWQALESKGWLRYALFILAAFEVVVIFFTATRGAVLGLIGAAGIGSILWMIESGSKGRKWAGGLLAGLIVIAGGVYMLRESSFVQSEPTLARVTSISFNDLKVRSTLWGMALKGVAERPITGWGQEGFNYVFNQFYEPALYAQEPWFDRAHDVFIDWLVAGGIPALLLFLGLLGSAVVALYRREAPRSERVMLIAAMVAYGIQGIVVFDNLFTYVPLAAILATAHAASARPWKRIESIETASESVLQVAVPLVAVIAFAVVWVVNVPNIAAANELVHAISLTSNDISPNVQYFQEALGENTYATQEIREQLVMFTTQIASQQQGASPTLQKLGEYAMSEMGKEIELQPKDARLRLEYALGFRVLGDPQDALKQIAIAHTLSPRKQTILLEQGIEYWQTNDLEKARESFHAAYDLDRSFAALAAYAAAGDIAVGNIADGKKLLIESQGTTTIDSEPLILAYYQTKQYDELIRSLQLQVVNQGGSVASRFRLAAAYSAAGRNADARAEIQATIQDHPEAAAQGTDFLKHLP